jgi:hypothetical protein
MLCPILLDRIQHLQADTKALLQTNSPQACAIARQVSTRRARVDVLVTPRHGRPILCLGPFRRAQLPRADTDGQDPTTRPQVGVNHLSAVTHRSAASVAVAAQRGRSREVLELCLNYRLRLPVVVNRNRYCPSYTTSAGHPILPTTEQAGASLQRT